MNSLDDFTLQSKPPNNRTTPIADIAARLRAQLASPQPAIAADIAIPGEPDVNLVASPEMTCEPGSASPESTIEAQPAITTPESASMLAVQIWPTLARLAIASGEGPYFRLWALLSEYSRRDGGRGSFRMTSESQCALATSLGITPRTLNIIVKRGDGIYWSRGGNRLWQVSAVKVYEHLQGAAQAAAIAGYDEPNRCKMLIPLECFSSLELFYATCLNAWLADRKASELMITWKVLAGWWGRNRACLNRWMDLAGIQRTENWGKRRIGSAERRTGLFDVIEDPATGNPNMVVEAQGQLWLMYQRGNTYYANPSVSRANKGAAKLLNAHSGNQVVASKLQDAERWDRDNLKANFASVDAQLKYKKKHKALPDISYTRSAEQVLVGPRVRGRTVWRAWEA